MGLKWSVNILAIQFNSSSSFIRDPAEYIEEWPTSSVDQRFSGTLQLLLPLDTSLKRHIRKMLQCVLLLIPGTSLTLVSDSMTSTQPSDGVTSTQPLLTTLYMAFRLKNHVLRRNISMPSTRCCQSTTHHMLGVHGMSR